MSQPDFMSLWNFSNPVETEKQFRELLESGGLETSDRQQLLTQIARTQGLQGKFEDAHKTLNEVESSLDEQPATVHIRYLLERGRVFNSSKDTDKARPLFIEAWNTARDANEDGLAVDAAHMAAITFGDKPNDAMQWNLKALALAESSKQDSANRWLGSLYNNIGWTYHDKGDYTNALDTFQKALAWRQNQKAPGPIRVAKWSVARTLRSLDKAEEALVIQNELEEEYRKAGEEDGYVYEELAECHLKLGTDVASKWFAKAHSSLSKDKWLVENEPDRIARLKKLGNVE